MKSSLRNGVNYIKHAFSDLLFPRTCTFCDSGPVETRSYLCDTCSQSIRTVSHPFCIQCGLPIPGLALQSEGVCGRCLTAPPPYHRARFGAYYEGPLRESLIRFKFSAALHVGRTLSQILLEAFQRHFTCSEFDLIVPVPVHRKRLFHRGFNQAVILAAGLSARTALRLDRTSLTKIKDTPPQVGLPKAQRVANLRNSFGVQGSINIREKRILLIDDVATTGTTISEAAKVLMKAGASRVDALVLALRTADIVPSILPRES
ncbi:MAG TPA: ComF family protein [Desulfomonilaceae bacterium]|nr:ComF family protein [Desulfomonilaceae bacterium]